MSSSVLPESWEACCLTDIAEWGSGGTPSRKYPEYYRGEIPWIKTGDLGPKVIYETSEYISAAAIKNSSARFFPRGSIAIAMYGATIGKTSILGMDATTNQACAVGIPIAGVTTTEFLYYFLLNEKERFIAKGKGGAQPNISQMLIKAHGVKLPSLAEQKIITEKLQTLLAQVEITKAHIGRIPQILKHFRQSVLAAAVSGKLTEEWRKKNKNRIDGNSLVSRLKQDHEIKGGHVRGNASDPTEGVHDLTATDIPTNWGISLLRDICIPGRPITYGILKPGPELETGVPYIRVADFPKNKLNLNNIKKTSHEIDEQYKRARLIAGDLLLSIRGSVGRLIKIPKEMDGANITQDTARLSLSDQVVADYIYYALLSDSVQRRMRNAIRGVAVRGINIGDVRALQIPIPSFDEQIEIVRQIEQFFIYADYIEQKTQISQERVNKLTQSILAKAFRGQLTEQWRKENPDLISGENSAAALIEKIKAEREILKNQPKIKKTSMEKKVAKTMAIEIKVFDALKEAGKPLSGQQLFSAAGYPGDSSTEQLERFFLDVRKSLTVDKTIIKIRRGVDSQDWFALAKSKVNSSKE